MLKENSMRKGIRKIHGRHSNSRDVRTAGDGCVGDPAESYTIVLSNKASKS